ncbi:MAG: hypothetical protein AAFN93_13365 [Bacteroidota bacterium]
MNKLIQIAAAIGLALTIIPGILIHISDITIEANKQFMIAGTIIWFLSAPLLMRRKKDNTA